MGRGVACISTSIKPKFFWPKKDPRSRLAECIVTASGPGFDDWQLRLATLPFSFRRLGVYYAGDVLNYAFLASRLQSASLQTKLLWHTTIASPGPIFDDTLYGFHTSM
nr:hypothetical protein [Tanacetum cinerariifolium]